MRGRVVSCATCLPPYRHRHRHRDRDRSRSGASVRTTVVLYVLSRTIVQAPIVQAQDSCRNLKYIGILVL